MLLPVTTWHYSSTAEALQLLDAVEVQLHKLLLQLPFISVTLSYLKYLSPPNGPLHWLQLNVRSSASNAAMLAVQVSQILQKHKPRQVHPEQSVISM